MTTVTITGATGFVGGALAGRLRARGDEVVALVRTPAHALEVIGVTQRVVDLTDAAAVTASLEGTAVLVHAAAGAGPDLATARVTNRDATRSLVDSARRVSLPRFVHVSTTSVYDTDAIGDAEATEDAPLVTDPGPDGDGSSAASPYAVTKAEAEAEVARGAEHGLSTVVLRPPAVLGAGATSTWGTKVPRLVRDGALPARNPSATFGYVAIDDLVDALIAALDGQAQGTVNVVGGHRTIGEYLRAVHAMVATSEPLALSDDEPAWQGRYATDRLPRVLGVTPRVGFDAAMATIAAGWPAVATG